MIVLVNKVAREVGWFLGRRLAGGVTLCLTHVHQLSTLFSNVT
jgi:hypothetical protein